MPLIEEWGKRENNITLAGTLLASIPILYFGDKSDRSMYLTGAVFGPLLTENKWMRENLWKYDTPEIEHIPYWLIPAWGILLWVVNAVNRRVWNER